MGKPLFPFPGWRPTTPVLPKLYWEAITPEQELQELCKRLHMLYDYASQLGMVTTEQGEQIQQLIEQFEKFVESGFDDYYKEQLKAYIEEHFSELMQQILNHGVYFGLTDDGYFCANVVWQLTVYFDTIADYASDDYGRLVLNY
jgi:glutathionyl-hydroquinone reductase